jgi:PIN domain nuclease of toxin-antitoxin system
LTVRYLLDTHALLWALGDPGTLAPAAREAIATPANLIHVSIASLWECMIKASIGKLELPPDFLDAIAETGYEVLPIRLSHLGVYRSLPMYHRDPFDRILIAQAQAESLVLMTRDHEIARYQVEMLAC